MLKKSLFMYVYVCVVCVCVFDGLLVPVQLKWDHLRSLHSYRCCHKTSFVYDTYICSLFCLFKRGFRLLKIFFQTAA